MRDRRSMILPMIIYQYLPQYFRYWNGFMCRSGGGIKLGKEIYFDGAVGVPGVPGRQT